MDPTNTQPVQSTVVPQPVDPYYSQKGGRSIIKKILILVTLIVILFLIVIGGIFLVSKFKGDEKPKDVTLIYWGLWDDANVMAPIIADFERIHPHTKIQYEKKDIKGLGDYVDRIAASINKGSGPDIYRFHSSWTQQLKAYLRPFPQKVVEEIQIDKDYYKTVQIDMNIDGAYYGVPLGIDTLALYVNTKLLNATGLPIPVDWNDVRTKYAPELVVKDPSGKIVTPSIALGTYDNVSHASDIVALLMLQNGADLKDLVRNGETNAEDGLTFYTDFAAGQNALTRFSAEGRSVTANTHPRCD